MTRGGAWFVDAGHELADVKRWRAMKTAMEPCMPVTQRKRRKAVWPSVCRPAVLGPGVLWAWLVGWVGVLYWACKKNLKMG